MKDYNENDKEEMPHKSDQQICVCVCQRRSTCRHAEIADDCQPEVQMHVMQNAQRCRWFAKHCRMLYFVLYVDNAKTYHLKEDGCKLGSMCSVRKVSQRARVDYEANKYKLYRIVVCFCVTSLVQYWNNLWNCHIKYFPH